MNGEYTKKGCYGNYQAGIARERRCHSCLDFPDLQQKQQLAIWCNLLLPPPSSTKASDNTPDYSADDGDHAAKDG